MKNLHIIAKFQNNNLQLSRCDNNQEFYIMENILSIKNQQQQDKDNIRLELPVSQKPTIKRKFAVKPIKPEETYDWLLKKHYAKRIPMICYSFGLYDNDLQGVCTFGLPPNYTECDAWKPFDLLELNRLVINENLDKNSLSFFVANCLKLLPQPKVIISYADLGKGHHGYIYQATNWVYTGIGGMGSKVYVTKDGKELHNRTVNIGDGGKYRKELYDKGIIVSEYETTGKARYYYFLGNKKTVNEMRKLLRFEILPYPKGANQRYDASYVPNTQQTLF